MCRTALFLALLLSPPARALMLFGGKSCPGGGGEAKSASFSRRETRKIGFSGWRKGSSLSTPTPALLSLSLSPLLLKVRCSRVAGDKGHIFVYYGCFPSPETVVAHFLSLSEEYRRHALHNFLPFFSSSFLLFPPPSPTPKVASPPPISLLLLLLPPSTNDV